MAATHIGLIGVAGSASVNPENHKPAVITLKGVRLTESCFLNRRGKDSPRPSIDQQAPKKGPSIDQAAKKAPEPVRRPDPPAVEEEIPRRRYACTHASTHTHTHTQTHTQEDTHVLVTHT